MAEISIEDQIKEVRRELYQRESVYQRLVGKGTLTQSKADLQTDRMKAVLSTLEKLQAERKPSLF